MSSISSLIAQNNPYEKFVQQLVQLESRNKIALQKQQSTQRERKTALSEVNNAITRFKSKMEELRKPETNAFQPFKNSVSNESKVRINSASNLNNAASFNLSIDRLASKDIALTGLLQGEGTELSTEGTASLTFTVGEKTETITVETADKSNAEVLQALADAINEQFEGALSASLFNVDGDNVQFSVKSNETGFANRIQIADATGDFAGLGFSKLIANEAELDARFTIDGVTFTRGSNTVSDAVEGVNFTLLQRTAENEPVTMDIQRDVEAARKNIDEFIAAFNNVNKTIRDRTFVDAENDRRGALQNMRVVRNLTVNLRQIAILPNENAGEGELSRLLDMGIEFQKDGTMVVKDSSKLNDLLLTRSDEIMKFFTDEESPISRMLEEATSYTESKTGLIATLQDGLDQRIDNLGRRIKAQEKYLERYEEQQRAQFNQLQLIIDQGTQQFNEIMAYQGRFMF
jgi:flagellar hook-associated protein 2